MFQNLLIQYRHWVTVLYFKTQIFIRDTEFVSCFKTHLFIRNTGSHISKPTYSSETKGFSPKFQNSHIHRKYWVQSQVLKLTCSSDTLSLSHVWKLTCSPETLSFSPMFHVSKLRYIGNAGFQSFLSKLT